MRKQRIAGVFFPFMALLGLASLVVFACSAWKDLNGGGLEPFELVARGIGYGLVIAIDGLCAASAYRCRKQGDLGRGIHVATGLAFAAVLLLCVHDVLLYEAYGNQLEGTFTMTAFFALDAGLLALYPVLLFLERKRPASPALPVVLLALMLLWALYIVGDMAGYPAALLTDWDEALIKLSPLCHAWMLFLFRDMRHA